jgi:hypothetical protein
MLSWEGSYRCSQRRWLEDPRQGPTGDSGEHVVIVTMGCGDACPYISGEQHVDWELPDLKGRPISEVRATRDEIARRIDSLVQDLNTD